MRQLWIYIYFFAFHGNHWLRGKTNGTLRLSGSWQAPVRDTVSTVVLAKRKIILSCNERWQMVGLALTVLHWRRGGNNEADKPPNKGFHDTYWKAHTAALKFWASLAEDGLVWSWQYRAAPVGQRCLQLLTLTTQKCLKNHEALLLLFRNVASALNSICVATTQPDTNDPSLVYKNYQLTYYPWSG